jgi:hypothetical protein
LGKQVTCAQCQNSVVQIDGRKWRDARRSGNRVQYTFLMQDNAAKIMRRLSLAMFHYECLKR